MGGTGLEPVSASGLSDKDLRQVPDAFGTESGTLQGETGMFPPDLAEVIDAWPALPEAIKAGILATVKAAGGITGQDR